MHKAPKSRNKIRKLNNRNQHETNWNNRKRAKTCYNDLTYLRSRGQHKNTQPNTTLNNLKNIYNKVDIVQANKINSKRTETSWIHFWCTVNNANNLHDFSHLEQPDTTQSNLNDI